MASALELKGVSAGYGETVVLEDIELALAPGESISVIGRNGVGKTTLVNLLTGVISPTSGQVLLKGRNITAVGQAERVKLGIARTFQINRLFRGLSVLENVYIAVAERMGAAPS